MSETNWAGNYTYRARAIHRPSSVEEVQEIVSRAPRIRVLGSRHAFTDIADSHELLSLERLPLDVRVEGDAVSCSANARYEDLFDDLDREGVALGNLASLPQINVAGAIATATHGSGDTNGNLATAVRSLDLITWDGELRTLTRAETHDDAFDGVVVSLGALAVVIRVELDVEPTYEVSQVVYEDVAWPGDDTSLHALMSAGYSVSLFTRWDDTIDQVWVKRRSDGQDDAVGIGGRLADGRRHPIDGLDPANCTAQRGVLGPWWDRLPHFRRGLTPSSGDELQSEYLIPRSHALEAIAAVRDIASFVRPVLQVSEIRTIAADRLWMSPQYGTDTIGIHFTWTSQRDDVLRAMSHVEHALEPLGARPHWGKLFDMGADRIAALYPRHGDFVRLIERFDPRGAFRNVWLERHVLST